MVLKSTQLWSKLIDEIIDTQRGFSSLSKLDFDWFKDTLLSIIFEISGDDLYRCLVLSNRYSGCGQFALGFNNKLAKVILARSSEELTKFITSNLDILIPEISKNENLSSLQKDTVISNLKTEMLALNMTMDTLLSSSMSYSSKFKILGGQQHL